LSTPTLDPGAQPEHYAFTIGTSAVPSANELRFQEKPAMAFVSLRQVLDHAAEHGYGVPAFNVNNLEQIHAIMEAADETQSPVILQASAGARKYAGEPYLRHMVLAAVEAHPGIPIGQLGR
jgi:Fructose-bisphosphate aldolase class-II